MAKFSEVDTLSEDDIFDISRKNLELPLRQMADKLTTIAVRQLKTSSSFKKERMNKIKKYEQLRQGMVPRKFRQLFTVPFPAFAGFVDTLETDFSDPITCKFMEEDASDYFKVRKIQSAFDQQRKVVTPNGLWDLKVRLDKKNAIMSGRGILKYYASSDPEYTSHFDVIDYNFFHNQPTGGAILENHLFCGEEAILRTEGQLIDGALSGVYDKQQVAELIRISSGDEYVKLIAEDKEAALAKFRALGLDPESHGYIGERTFSLCQWELTYNNTRWYLLFDPYTKTWLRCEKLKDVSSGEYWDYMSWSTHEDQRVFWNVGYSDYFYPISDAIITLLNQELTNREKSNFGARAYDEEMFYDEAKLDEAQYRPDSLVPVDTMNGTKKIGDGIYRFDTPQLEGTINLVDWVHQQAGDWGGATDFSQGAASKPGTKAYVQFQQQQQIAKRISYKANAYQECYQQVGLRFIQGLKDHMPAKMAVKMVGADGYDHWDEVTRIELSLNKTPHIEIQSTTAQEQADKMKGDSQIQVLEGLAGNGEISERSRVEYLLRRGGRFDDMEVKMLMDKNSYVDKDAQAKAAIAIKMIVEEKEPETNYNADLAFLKIIQNYVLEHMTMLKKRGLIQDFTEYIKAHAIIAAQNMARLAKQMQMEQQMKQMTDPDATANAAKPNSRPASKKPIARSAGQDRAKLNVQKPQPTMAG